MTICFEIPEWLLLVGRAVVGGAAGSLAARLLWSVVEFVQSARERRDRA